jgi:hypothetical protein
VKARIQKRHLRNTGRNTETVGPRRALTAFYRGSPPAASGCSRERNCGDGSAITEFRALVRSAIASTCGCPAKRDRSGGRGIPRHFRLAAQVSTAGNRSDTCEASHAAPLFGRMRRAIDRPRDRAAAMSYGNLPLKARPIPPSANHVGGCGYYLNLLNIGSSYRDASDRRHPDNDAKSATLRVHYPSRRG